jgi:hypothetical protein
VDETGEVIAVNRRVIVRAGHFKQAIVIRETTKLSHAIERKSHAPGVGVLTTRAKGEVLDLIASTLTQAK